MKQVRIDNLVSWAWQRELPKGVPVAPLLPSGFSNPWASLSAYGALLAHVQTFGINRYGVVPEMNPENHQPHPDAVTVWRAVQDLAGLAMTIPEDWAPIDDLGLGEPYTSRAVALALERLCFHVGKPPVAEPVGETIRRYHVKQRDGGMALRKSATELVQFHAVVGGHPQWKTPIPQRRTVNHTNGQAKWFRRFIPENSVTEIEGDGIDAKTKRPHTDAYLKHYYDPDPADIVEGRAEYEIWHAAHMHLWDELRGRLEAHDVLPLEQSARPWETGERPAPRILTDLRAKQPRPSEPTTRSNVA